MKVITMQSLSMEHRKLYLTPFQRKLLLKKLNESELSSLNRQRIQIMILADEGMSQSAICQEVGCCASTARHWSQMARSGMAHLWEDSPRGRPKVVTDAYLERLRELLTQSPRDYKYPFTRWTADWLRKHLAQEYEIEVSLRHFKRLLKQVKNSTDFHSVINQRSQTDVTLLRGSRSNADSPSNLKIADLTLERQGYSSEMLSPSLTSVEKTSDLYGTFNL
jgi:transposase